MMYEVWNKISYMVQLIAACYIFMVPAVKRRGFFIRSAACSLVLLIYAYLINSTEIANVSGLMPIFYWSHFPILCIPLVFISLNVSITEALYCVLLACAMQHLPYDLYMIYERLLGEQYAAALLLYIIIYGLFYFLYAKKLLSDGRFAISLRSIFPMATIVLIVWVLSCLEAFYNTDIVVSPMPRILYRICDGLCCFYVLWIQQNHQENMKLQRELDGINHAWRIQTAQYKVTGDTIDNINRKCHDLKHQIRTLRSITDEVQRESYFDEIEQDIMIYDTALETGNRALNIVLMEKGLLCKNHEIQWSCMADGQRLGFMRPEDIYALFGNALDNAIAAVLQLADVKKRVISVKILTQNDLMMIQIQNYYENEIRFEGGLPLTTKRNKRDHGFGMKSIRHTAEKYNGTITVSAKNQIFMLQILMPVVSSQKNNDNIVNVHNM